MILKTINIKLNNSYTNSQYNLQTNHSLNNQFI